MKLSLPNDVYIVRETGLPVEGRMKVYLHESDTFADVYTLEGSQYVQAENPQLLHAGLPEASMFTDTGLYDIVIEQYIGEEGQMSVESPDSDFARIDEFQWGLDFDPEQYVTSRVDTMAELRRVDPSLKAVTVLWYDEPGDCMPRTYWWDAAAMNDEDGGYVIASDVSDTGRWILMWGDEMMPACVYGVSDSDSANMNLLLNYPATVGSFLLKTAPIVRIPAGTYSTDVIYATAKELAFDRGAKFTAATFRCPKATMLGGNSSYVADFEFTAPGMEAHSSWFRTVQAFWHCGAQTMCADSTNYFDDSALRTVASLSGITVKGSGSLVTSYVNGSYFQVVRICSVPAGFFTANDYVRLGAGFGDEVFAAAGAWDPGLIAQGHHQQYDQVPELVRFASADRWLSTMLERRDRLTPQVWSQCGIDLLGRKVSSFTLSASSFTFVNNAVVDGRISVRGTVLNLENVKAELYVSSGEGCDIAAVDSELEFHTDSAWVKSVNLVDCDTSIAGNGFDPTDTEVTVTGGSFSGKVWLKDANAEGYVINKAVTFRDARIEGNATWRLNRLYMAGCRCSQKLDLYPANGGDNHYYWNLVLEGNTFTGNSRVWFGVYASSSSTHSELEGHCLMNNCRIVGNRFDGTDALGVKMLEWHPVTGNLLLSGGSTWEYHGNSGHCPRLNPGFLPNTDKWPETQGTNPVWRVYDGVFNIWAPYNVYGTGFTAAQEPTGLNGQGLRNAVWAQFYTETITDPIGHYLYAYRTYYTAADMADEDKNNAFVVKLGMGVGGASVPTFNVGNTYFPGLSVV